MSLEIIEMYERETEPTLAADGFSWDRRHPCRREMENTRRQGCRRSQEKLPATRTRARGSLRIAALAMLFVLPVCAVAQGIQAGAYYFDGWTSQSERMKHLTPRLRHEFFDREPVWGWRDDNPEVMKAQIDMAAENELSFFAFDWYYPEGADKTSPLNNALGLYLSAPNKAKLKFCLMVANHSGFRIGPEDWDSVCDLWLPLMQDAQHLAVDGKPLIIFFAPDTLSEKFGSAEAVKAAFDKLRVKAKARGRKGVTIAACATPGPDNNWSDLSSLAAQGYDCLTGYNYPGHPMKGTEKIQSYSSLVEGHIDIWKRFASKKTLPYIPVVTTGWDPRPWQDPTMDPQKVYYPDRTPEQLKNFVFKAAQWIDSNPKSTPKEKILIFYAWNENGEGGYLTPTRSDGGAYLRAVGEGLSQRPE